MLHLNLINHRTTQQWCNALTMQICHLPTQYIDKMADEAGQAVAACIPGEYRERKVRAPQSRMTVNDRPPRGEEQGHRDERIQLR